MASEKKPVRKTPDKAVSKSIARHQAKQVKRANMFGRRGTSTAKVSKALDDIFGKAGLVMDYISGVAARRASGGQKGVRPKTKLNVKGTRRYS